MTVLLFAALFLGVFAGAWLLLGSVLTPGGVCAETRAAGRSVARHALGERLAWDVLEIRHMYRTRRPGVSLGKHTCPVWLAEMVRHNNALIRETGVSLAKTPGMSLSKGEGV